MDIRVVTGSVDLSDVPASHVFSVSQVVVNPHYDWHDYSGDAALLVLSKPSTAPALRLARPDETDLYTPGTVAEMAGWGLDGYGNSSALLQAASTTVKGPNYCQRYNDWYTETWETCAVDEPSLATGTCNGDSGGPLLTSDASGQPVEIGVTSVGPTNCNTYTADYFTRADQLSKWANALVDSLTSTSDAATHTTTTTASTTTSSKTTSTTTTTSTDHDHDDGQDHAREHPGPRPSPRSPCRPSRH